MLPWCWVECILLSLPAFAARLAGYDEEARYFEPGVSAAKRLELVAALEGLVRPAYEGQLALLRELALTVFQQQMQREGEGAPDETFVQRAQRCAAERFQRRDGIRLLAA